MPKNQHGKDKMYLTQSEWREMGGKKKRGVVGYKRLPFYCCALTLQPFTKPVALYGSVYDFVQIVQYLKQHGTDPVSGKKASVKDLVHLNFFKNQKDKFHDPVSFRELSDNSHIVAIRTSGNVFTNETVKSLNVKANNWLDLISNESFTKDDIIELQNPDKAKIKEYENFVHLKDDTKRLKKAKKDTEATIVTSATADRILVQARKLQKERELAAPKISKSTDSGIKVKSRHTTGQMAASLTSTAVDVVTENEYAVASSDEINQERWRRLRKMKKKGYMRFVTNLGDLNLELHFDACPIACENFITLAQSGYYNNTCFHRKIPSFMVQGGDPTGTGSGGQSIWGKPFQDEIQTKYTHSGRGVLAMANSGPKTNKSQFYITFGACSYLDKKHTVFGRLVGGFETLDEIEIIPTDKHTKPRRKIEIKNTLVFVNPVEELEKIMQNERAEEQQEAARKAQLKEIEKKAAKREKLLHAAKQTQSKGGGATGVGRYLASTTAKSLPKPKNSDAGAVARQAKKTTGKAWSFSSW